MYKKKLKFYIFLNRQVKKTEGMIYIYIYHAYTHVCLDFGCKQKAEDLININIYIYPGPDLWSHLIQINYPKGMQSAVHHSLCISQKKGLMIYFSIYKYLQFQKFPLMQFKNNNNQQFFWQMVVSCILTNNVFQDFFSRLFTKT